MLYCVVEESCYPSGKSTFEKAVNDLISKGWQPQGGVGILHDPVDINKPRKLYQAMIKV